MTTRILLSTTSYQDTPGPHHALLESQGYEIVRKRGPLPEHAMLELAGSFDGFLCGDDAITRAAIEKSLPRLKIISKYGIGLDKIDLACATENRIPVLFTPGVNHTTVAEHAFGLLLSLSKRIQMNAVDVRAGHWVAGWKKPVGNEAMGKTIGIVGLGRIGKEVAIRARAFGMKAIAFDPSWDETFAREHGVEKCASIDQLLRRANIVSLHCFLDQNTHGMIDSDTIAGMQDGVIVINCARGELVKSDCMAHALESGKVAGYGADVLEAEPPAPGHPLLRAPNCIITSHIASRTHESVIRQALRATNNLIHYLNGDPDYIQANPF